MALQRARHFISEQQYLDGDRLAEIRHEYIDGEVFAMAGTSRNHQRLVGNLYVNVSRHLNNTSCEVFSNEIKVKADHCFFYPDLIAVCDDPQGDDYFTEQSRLFVEVLSKSTRRLDKTTKLVAYKALPSFQEYVLVEQDHVEVEVFHRSQNWFREHYFLGDDIEFESIGLTVAVSELYHRIDNEDMRDYLEKSQQRATL